MGPINLGISKKYHDSNLQFLSPGHTLFFNQNRSEKGTMLENKFNRHLRFNRNQESVSMSISEISTMRFIPHQQQHNSTDNKFALYNRRWLTPTSKIRQQPNNFPCSKISNMKFPLNYTKNWYTFHFLCLKSLAEYILRVMMIF